MHKDGDHEEAANNRPLSLNCCYCYNPSFPCFYDTPKYKGNDNNETDRENKEQFRNSILMCREFLCTEQTKHIKTNISVWLTFNAYITSLIGTFSSKPIYALSGANFRAIFIQAIVHWFFPVPFCVNRFRV